MNSMKSNQSESEKKDNIFYLGKRGGLIIFCIYFSMVWILFWTLLLSENNLQISPLLAPLEKI